MKKFLLAVMVLAMGVTAFGSVWADCPSAKHQCASEKTCTSHGRASKASDDSMECPIISKVMKKSAFLLSHKTALNLTEDQIKTIQEVQSQVTKSGIRMKADMQIFMMDLNDKLAEDKVDIDGISVMLDEGMSGMALASKANVQSYARLKSVITPEQLVIAKDLWQKDQAGACAH